MIPVCDLCVVNRNRATPIEAVSMFYNLEGLEYSYNPFQASTDVQFFHFYECEDAFSHVYVLLRELGKELIFEKDINLDDQDPAIPLNVPRVITRLQRPEAIAISNSFGFGGHNAVLAFRNI